MKDLKINVYTEAFDILKIPQHPRVAGFEGEQSTFVFNYAVKVSDLDGDGPINQPNGTKPIKAENFTQPGLLSFEERSYANVTYQNIGNSLDKIQNLTISFPDLHPLNIDPGLDESWMSEVNQMLVRNDRFAQTNQSHGLVFMELDIRGDAAQCGRSDLFRGFFDLGLVVTVVVGLDGWSPTDQGECQQNEHQQGQCWLRTGPTAARHE